ncbi:MAG: hypothetical protein NXI18_21690 [Alphaproteobacteria bacterium]|nr:hypothetical protein [Alphaproteobacteria bacterium]
MPRTLLAALVASLVSCASPPPVLNDLVAGVYQETGPLDPGAPDDLQGRHVWTFLVLDRPIRRWNLPWGALKDVDYFPSEGLAWFCVVEEMH